MSTLVDEKAVRNDLSADRELAEFSELSPELHKKIFEKIKKHILDKEKTLDDIVGQSFMVENKTIQDLLSNISRYYGVNMRAFEDHHTMEFRYFSSQIAPEFGKFKQWIKYFMLIAKIGQSRNQFIIGKGQEYPLVFTREEKNKTKITILDKKGKMPKKPNISPVDIKKSSGGEDLKQKLKNKAAKTVQREFPFMKKKLP